MESADSTYIKYCEESLINAIYNNNFDAAKKIAITDNFVNAKVNGETALFVALKLRHRHIFEMLLSQPNLDVNQRTLAIEDAAKTSREQSALVYTYRWSHRIERYYMRRLLERGADPNSITRRRTTILYECCKAGYEAAVHELLAFGADPTIVSPSGLLPLDFTVWTCSKDAVELVLDSTYKQGKFPLKLKTLVGLMEWHGECFMKILHRVCRVDVPSARAVDFFTMVLGTMSYEMYKNIMIQFPNLRAHVKETIRRQHRFLTERRDIDGLDIGTLLETDDEL